jgi:hypothetical protein
MPSLAELGKVIQGRNDMVLVTVNTDETADDVRGTLRSVLSTDKPPFIVLLDPEASVVRDRYGTRLYPETWFIDPKGVIRARVDAARNWDDSVPLDMAKALLDPLSCEISFTRGRPGGELAGLCSDVAPSLGAQE